MIRLIQRRLIIPRGDTGSFSIPTIGTVGASDIAIFGIFDPLTHKTLVMKKIQATNDFLTITLDSEDTINLEPRKYNWDITIYKSPIYDEENELVGAAEVNSYYSAFRLPICEITEVALDMDKNRWRTSTLTLDTNEYQAANSIQAVYPWENIQRAQLSQQIHQIAQEYGFNKGEDEFWARFTTGILVLDSFSNFPQEGQEDTLYYDKDEAILYYFKIINGEVSEELINTIGAKIVVQDENTTSLYIPIKALPIEVGDNNG